MRRSRRLAPLVVVVAAGAAALGAVPAAGAVQRGAAAKPFLDVRDAQRRAVEQRGGTSLRAPDAATRAARGRLRADRGADIEVDRLTGTPRVLSSTTEPLSAPSGADRREIAERFVRTNLAALGLDATDLGSLQLAERTTIPGGAQELGYRQYADGIPSFDGGLRVVVDSRGRVVTVIGAPQADLRLATTTPALSAADALRKLMDDVGFVRDVRVASGPSGTRRETAFTGGETAALVAFGDGTSARLAWQLDYRATPTAHYSAVVDAATGAVLYRANSVKFAANDASVWEQFPGAANGGTPHTVDLTPYLNAGATDLSGPFAHAWSDTNDNDTAHISSDGHIIPLDAPDAGETVTRTGTGGSFTFGFTTFSGTTCATATPCSWVHTTRTSWQTNRAENAVQAFYYVNKYREHLLAAPIGFNAADGNFDNGDRLLVNTDDGAATGSGGGPDNNHLDNAYMDTPADGKSPTMAMFLFTGSGFRDVNGGDDAAVVYHEYTHGLSGRLVTNGPGGGEALNSDQSGAMGEAWSDWYAKDFLIDQFPSDDTAATGDVDMGKYTDATAHNIRTQGLDCPVGDASGNCPGGAFTLQGGYTYGDFGFIDSGGPEVHADGEIWGETLWDLRSALGSAVTEAIVTQGMRISPPEPTFLDERDAILTADRQLFPDNDHSGQIWAVFAHRGMGSNALTDGGDIAIDGSKQPPTAALTASPSPANPREVVTLDASGSHDPDGSVARYDFDFQGDGTPEITGTTNPRQTFTYTTPGTYHPEVTVYDNENQPDTASRTLVVNPGPSPTPTPSPSPSPSPTPTPTPTPGSNPAKPKVTLPSTGSKSTAKFKVTCDSPCSGSAKLTISKKVAKQLGLRSRTVGTLKVRLTAKGTKTFTIKLTGAAKRAMKRNGVKRIATTLTVTVTDAERQRASPHRITRIRS